MAGERRQLAQHPEHALRLRDHARRQSFERLQPVAPDLRRGPIRHLGEDRFGERSQRPQLLAIAHQARAPATHRDPRSWLRERADRTRARDPLSRRCQRSSRPITAASTIRSSQRHGARSVPATSRSVSPRIVAAWPLPRAARLRRGLRAAGPPRRAPRPAATTSPHRRLRSAAPGPANTYSANRRADSSSSAQASSASSARPAGIGTSRAAMEPGGNAGAIERVLEHAEIGLRRAQQHRHLIERHAALGFLQQAARNLDRFAAFARRREQHHRFVLFDRAAASRSKTGSAVVAAQLHRVHQVHRVHRVHQSSKCLECLRVAGRHRGNHRCRGRDHRVRECCFGSAIQSRCPVAPRSCRASSEGSRAVPPWRSRAWSRNQPRRPCAARQSRARAARRDRCSPRARAAAPGPSPAIRSSPKRAAERARKSRHVGDGREVLEDCSS